ncbi:RNI-like protein [Scleroderma citrinum]
MSRRRNNVRGPTSALTEFLRESGINPELIARRAATQNQNQTNAQPAASPSTSTDAGASAVNGGGEQANPTPEASSSGQPPQNHAQAGPSGYASDQLDEPEESSPTKQSRSTRATTAAKKRAKKKAKGDGDYKDSSEDEYTALAKNMWATGGSGGPKPPIGSFESCAKCKQRFTVTKYTMAANPPPGYLCHQCAKASGVDPFKKPAAPRNRKPPAEKRDVVNFEQRRLPTLAALCIELISKHIDDVEALGDVGLVNMDEIAKALAKNRGLTAQNAHLFYDVRNKFLRLYDATYLTPSALSTLSSLNPNLTHLHLDLCGRMTSHVLEDFARFLPHLTSLSLLGPFLVRAEAWIKFFHAKPDLRSFRITQSPRFDVACAKQLAESCTKLEELQLREVGLLDDDFVEPLCALPPLKLLDLANPIIGIEEDGWLKLMKRHGGTLEKFNPSWDAGFTDRALCYGVGKYARALSELTLEGCESLSNESVSEFFQNWKNPCWKEEEELAEDAMDTAEDITLPEARNHVLSDATLTALLDHSGPALVSLDLNGLRSLSSETLASLKCASGLRRLDLSWCRELDDFVMKEIVGAMSKLEEIKVWGCSRVRGTGWAGKRGLRIYGIEPNAGR